MMATYFNDQACDGIAMGGGRFQGRGAAKGGSPSSCAYRIVDKL